MSAIDLDGGVVKNSTHGLATLAGAITARNVIVENNGIGVGQYGGAIDLSGGGNTVICSLPNAQVPIAVGVYNDGTTVLNASNVAWDTAGPDYFACNDDFSLCACNNQTCSTAPGSSGMDAVEDSVNLGAITTTGNTLSAYFLDAGCQ